MWKTIVLDAIAILILVLQNANTIPFAPASWAPYEALALVVLNAIAQMIQTQKLIKLEKDMGMRK